MDNLFEILQVYVPDVLQNSPKEFFSCLKRKEKNMRHVTRFSNIVCCSRGIEVYSYEPRLTLHEFYTWSQLDSIINERFGYLKSDKLKALQAQMEF